MAKVTFPYSMTFACPICNAAITLSFGIRWGDAGAMDTKLTPVGKHLHFAFLGTATCLNGHEWGGDADILQRTK